MLRIVLYLVLTSLAQFSYAHPNNRHERDTSQKNIIATATNILTTNVLKGNADHNRNFVVSPLGYASILAILSEGAKGDTLVDISSMLKHPEERSRVRLAYKNFLNGLQGDNPSIAPQFKTWFYIYKNNTVEDDFRKSIHDNYFVEVKDIDRQNDDEEESISTVTETENSDLAYVEDAKQNEKEREIKVSVTIAATNDTTNSKDIPDFETLKKTHPAETPDETRLIDEQEDSSKFDEVVEDRQYVEVPVIKEEILKKTPAVEDVKIVAKEAEVVEDKKEIFVKETEKLEIMQAEARNLGQRQFGSTNTGEVASALSGNSIVGRKTNSRQPDKENESKMLLFNGLYYKGNWAIPFQQLRSDTESVFYTSDSEKIPVKMMRARGFYRIAECKNLKATAIDLPYDNERYSFLVLLPNTRDGLKTLLDDLSTDAIPDVIAQLQEESIDISIPKFSIDTTGGIEKNLAKNGLASIFTSKADLSGITTEQKLHIEEVQQHVALRVDEGSSSENFLTATNALRSNAQPEQSIVVNRPFVFFVRDVTDGVIIMAGKVTSPPTMDEPII
ncbi:serpin I2 [Bradysia coprophila]|uniref:serpin I2 n=1 Tax=Bradysia coprophila TaxID=38358 RepID=UPI00187D7011|nr:serpin I2 [Bradysia coprophila]